MKIQKELAIYLAEKAKSKRQIDQREDIIDDLLTLIGHMDDSFGMDQDHIKELAEINKNINKME